MKRNCSLLDILTEKNYLYGKNRKYGLGYVLERNVPTEECTDKKYRLITLGKGAQIREIHFFNPEECHLFMAPLQFVSMNLLRKYWN